MLSLKKKDLKVRQKFLNNEKTKRVNKFLFVNTLNSKRIDNLEKTFNVFYKKGLNRSLDSKVRITRRCIINNRNRSVIRPFGISRVYLRELLQFGLLPGYTKAVW
jgi:ribosomal protein S14